MKITKDEHIEFYDWQLKILEEDWLMYANGSMKILLQEKRMFVGRIWGFDQLRGTLILRFKSGTEPRMKNLYTLSLIGAKAGSNPMQWNFSYKDFWISNELSGESTLIKTEFYLKSENNNWNYIGVTRSEHNFVQEIKKRFLDKRMHPIIVLAEKDPPYQYLLNLKQFISNNPDNPILNLPLDKLESDWKPANIDNSNDILPLFIDHLSVENNLIIQGPPGTGKSYLVAEICDYFLSKNYSIVISALANRALIEVAEKKGLQKWIMDSKVFKTNLSSDEKKKIPKLNQPLDITPNKGELLLTTYYSLSDKLNYTKDDFNRYDLLIIEEASQAFLATIAGFSTLAKKVMVIGDHKQLPPIVKKESDAKKIHSDVRGIIYGMETYILNNDCQSNRLTMTRRLNSPTAELTGIFYDNCLESISKLNGSIKFESKFKNLFAKNGGISIVKLPLVPLGYSKTDIINLIIEIGLDILKMNNKDEVAFLTPNVNIENSLYYFFNKKSSDYSRTTISTIHKIQGLTTDFVILYLPMNNPRFELDENLFNVATSRAKKGTLIFTNKSIEMVSSTSNSVSEFLSKVIDVSDGVMTLLK